MSSVNNRNNTNNNLSRRQTLKASALAAAAFATGSFPLGWTRAADDKTRKVLFFTKSSGFQHSVVARSKDAPDKLALAEQTLVDLGKEHGFDVTVTKDGSVFTPEKLAEFDVIAFYTTGDLDKADSDHGKDTGKPAKDGGVPMPAGGFDALLKHLESGKGMIGFHCAADTFNHHGDEPGQIHPYVKLIGAEFDGHNKQQKSKLRFVKGFAPIEDMPDLELTEEWYRYKNIAPDLQVIFVQETATMEEQVYKDRKPYPETWARSQGKGRVFYTSMGHREDVWTNPQFQQVLLGGLSWAAGNVPGEVKPNLKEACPDVEHVRKD